MMSEPTNKLTEKFDKAQKYREDFFNTKWDNSLEHKEKFIKYFESYVDLIFVSKFGGKS